MENIINIIISFLKANSLNLIWIILLYLLGKTILKTIIKRLVKFADDGNDKKESIKEKRAKTLGKVIITVGNAIIYATILLMLLNVFGIDIGPILAGVGIIGLAVGFGAQSLVKNFVAGLFILLENQYSIGDRVKIGSFEGRVKRITLNSTVLKNDKGEIFYTPNGIIKDVINYSQK